MNKTNTPPTKLNIDFLSEDFTNEDWQAVKAEKKYYELLLDFKKTRQNLGFTQQELAKKAQIPRTTITKIESGNRNSTIDTLMRLAQAMGKRLELTLV